MTGGTGGKRDPIGEGCRTEKQRVFTIDDHSHEEIVRICCGPYYILIAIADDTEKRDHEHATESKSPPRQEDIQSNRAEALFVPF